MTPTSDPQRIPSSTSRVQRHPPHITPPVSSSFDPSKHTSRLSESPRRSVTPTFAPRSFSGQVDRKDIVRRHLARPATSASVEGGRYTRHGADTTYDIYKWVESAEGGLRGKSRSFTDLRAGSPRVSMDEERDAVAPSMSRTSSRDPVQASDLRLPGAFRRHHIRHMRSNSRYTEDIDELEEEEETFTKSFIDFLALYGHFAGDEFLEDWEEDELATADLLPPLTSDVTMEPTMMETTPLLGDAPSRMHTVATTTSHKPSPATASTRKIFLLLLKSFIGTGVLFLPRSFHSGGLLFSLFVLIAISALCLYAMLLLIECRSVIPGSFGDIGGHIYGKGVRRMVRASVFISQMGFTCAYAIFVARNLRDVISLATRCQYQPSEASLILMQFWIYAPLALIRKIKHLSSFALIADVFIVAGLCYLFVYDVMSLMVHGVGKGVRMTVGPDMSVFIGTAVFTFEGIGLMIPIVESMKKPEKFPSLLASTMVLVLAIFCSIGALSYLTFGGKVETVVLRNLPASDPTVILLQLLYTLAILFSVPLQLFPAVGILEHALFRVRSGRLDPKVKWRKNIVRGCITALAIGGAYAGASSFDRFVAIVGSFACIPLSFIYPALFHLKAVATTRWQKCADVLLATFGIVAMVWTTWMTLSAWLEGNVEAPSNRCDVDAVPPVFSL